MLAIEQFELKIQHIKGTDNTLADILSRNTPNSSTIDIPNLKQRGQI
jgi:hypothetical protein